MSEYPAPQDVSLARVEARELQRQHPALFQEVPVPIFDVARVLDLKVEKRPELRQRARLEILKDEVHEAATIAIKPDLDRNVSRFAVAHEIGHVILIRKHPDAARDWEVRRREAFASTFAAELLAPPQLREELAQQFVSLTDPVALLRLASRLGLSPRAFLTLTSQEKSWTRASNKVWLRVKHIANTYTQQDPKLRIVSAYYDRDRFYIPLNQSFARFAGDDSWLASLPPGTIATHVSEISLSFKRERPTKPKFLSMRVPARLSALRLQASAAEPGAYLIVLADLQPSRATDDLRSPGSRSRG